MSESPPNPHHVAKKPRFDTVRILSIKQVDNKIQILKMVRRKQLIGPIPALANINCEEEKENVIEILDSDEEVEESPKSELKIAEVKSLSEKSEQQWKKNEQQEAKSDEKIEQEEKSFEQSEEKTEQQTRKPRRRLIKFKQQKPCFEQQDAFKRKTKKTKQNIEDLKNQNDKTEQQERKFEESEKFQQEKDEIKQQEYETELSGEINELKNDSIEQLKNQTEQQREEIDFCDNIEKFAYKIEQLNRQKELRDSKTEQRDNITEQQKEKNKQQESKTEQEQKSLDHQNESQTEQQDENFDLEKSQNDSNNNFTIPDAPQETPSHSFAKLKCYRGCSKNKIHQKKHNFDFSSSLGLIITKRDQVDEKYLENSLRKIEEKCSSDKIEEFLGLKRDGNEIKMPKGRGVRKSQTSEVLEMMKETGRDKSAIWRKI